MTTSVLFWFDVEDYITPESDDALKGLLEIFEAHGAQATWKLVAEKARVLEARGRTDIIRLLQRQDIGYHTDTHSVHPVLAEYLRDMGWEDGVQEVFRREATGYRDLIRICGPASTFGQAGGSWAPQIYPVLQELDIPLFMDEASHVGLDGEPFYYCRTLHINRMEDRTTRMSFRHGDEGLEEGKRRFADICGGGEGGLVSIYYHPCEWATHGFWDGVNFGRGANPPRSEWKPAPLRTQKEMRAGLELFSRYLGYVKDYPGVEIITGRQVVNALPDDTGDLHIDLEELAQIIDFPDGAISYCRLQDCSLSPSELFCMVAEGLLLCLNDGEEQSGHGGHLHTPTPTPYGPTRRISSSPRPGTPLSSAALFEGAADALQFIEVHERLPDCVWLGSQRLAPADFLVTAAELLRGVAAARGAGGSIPDSIPLRTGSLDLERQIADSPWGWVIFPPDFEAPGILELARLQTWTLKPALLQG